MPSSTTRPWTKQARTHNQSRRTGPRKKEIIWGPRALEHPRPLETAVSAQQRADQSCVQVIYIVREKKT